MSMLLKGVGETIDSFRRKGTLSKYTNTNTTPRPLSTHISHIVSVHILTFQDAVGLNIFYSIIKYIYNNWVRFKVRH